MTPPHLLERRPAWLDRNPRFLGPALIGPAALFIVLVVGSSVLLAAYLSLTDSRAGSLSGRFVGGQNFGRALSDPMFRKAVGNTLIVSVVAPVVAMVPAIVLSHFVARKFRWKWALLTVILLPWAAPAALEAMSWRWILDSLFSVLNWSLRTLGLIRDGQGPQWLGNPALAMFSVIVVHAWRILPFTAVVALSGLSSIPSEIHDAAAVDGAVGWRRLVYVTLPLLRPVMIVTLLFGIVFTANGMAVVYVLTQGGPFNSTHVASTWAYQTGIASGGLGEGAAISLCLAPLLALTSVLILRFARNTDVGW